MKRWIPALLIFAGLVVMLSPGIVGHLAERQIEQQLDLVAERNPLLTIATEQFTRGWFSSEGRHRVPLTAPELRDIVLAAAGADLDTDGKLFLIVDTRIDHGLVPLSAAVREASAALPGLASGISTMALELPDGRRVDLPGSVSSRIELDGSARLRYRVGDGAASLDGTSLTWSAANISVYSSADGRSVGGDADLSGWSIDAGDQQVSFSHLESHNELHAGPQGLLLGELAATVSNARIPMVGGRTLSWSTLSAGISSSADDERINGTFALDIDDLDDEATHSDIALVAHAGNLDARALRPLALMIGNSELQLATMDTNRAQQLELALRTLLSAGATIDIETFVIATPFGSIEATLNGELPAQDGVVSWPSIALAFNGKLDITVPMLLVENSGALREQVPMLLGMGLLLPEGDAYRMRASYENGMATVNGAPLPLGNFVN